MSPINKKIEDSINGVSYEIMDIVKEAKFDNLFLRFRVRRIPRVDLVGKSPNTSRYSTN